MKSYGERRNWGCGSRAKGEIRERKAAKKGQRQKLKKEMERGN